MTIDEAEQRLKALGFVHDNKQELWIFPQWALNAPLPPNSTLLWNRVLARARNLQMTEAAIMPIRPTDMPFLESIIEWLEFQRRQLVKEDPNSKIK